MGRAIPEGYHAVTPSVMYKDARKAIAFYEKAFGAKQTLIMPAPDGKIMHAEIVIGDSRLMLGEDSPNWGGSTSAEAMGGSPVSFALYVEDCDAAFEKAVAAGCKAEERPMDAFWGDRYGRVRDPFGYVWGICQRVKDLTPEQMTEAGRKWLSERFAGAGRK